MAFEFLSLRFAYRDLAPAMSEDTARRHREVEHRRYLEEINRLLEPLPEFAGLSIEEIMMHPDRIPEGVRDEIRFAAGGYGNHQFMWKVIGPERGTRPSGALADAIETTFGGLDGFLVAFKAAALAVDGDGWAFLSLSRPRAPAIEIVTTRGNGNVLELKKPGVLVCDLWAHAYAQDHRGDRSAWLDAYSEVLDWSVCTMRYELLVAGKHVP